MKRYSVDFETYYDSTYTLRGPRGLPTGEYVRHPKFDAYLVAIRGPDNFRWVGHPTAFDWKQIHGQQWLSHNTSFDEAVYNRLQTLGKISPEVQPSRWDCTADMAAYLHVPRNLDEACQYLLGHGVDKTLRDEMKGKKWEELGDAKKLEIIKYGLGDADCCYELYEKCHERWPEWEQQISRANRAGGLTGVRIDTKMLEESIASVVKQKGEAEDNIPWDWDPDKTPLRRDAIATECRKNGIPCPASLAEDDEECEAWEDSYSDKYAWVKGVRVWRKLHMVHKKLLRMRSGLDSDFFTFNVKYMGSHTGRFSGSDKFNMQNLPREPMFGVDLRNHIIADTDNSMWAIIDLAQIEARLLLWYVGDQEMLDLIRKGFGIYEAHARTTMNWKGEPGTLKKTDPDLYLLAKARVLALGYGCGAQKFISMAKKYCNLILTLDEAKGIVYSFRQSNPKIVAAWNHAQVKMELYAAHKADTFVATLTSGRNIPYFNPHLKLDNKSGKRNKVWAQFIQGDSHRSVYGGLVVENIIQGLARDLFCQGWVRLLNAGFAPRFTTHDEYVINVPKTQDLRELTEIIETPPEWAPDLPVGTSAELSFRYKK